MQTQLMGLNGEHAGEGCMLNGGYPAPGGFLLNDTWQVALLPAWIAGIRKG